MIMKLMIRNVYPEMGVGNTSEVLVTSDNANVNMSLLSISA